MLSFAAGNGRLECVAFLLEKGADPNGLKKGRDGPLHYAAHDGHTSCAALLLDKKADV